MREMLVSLGLPPWQADGVIEDYEHYRSHDAAQVTGTVRDLTRNDPCTFFQFAQDYAGRFISRAAGVA
jgi:hypothetical protein